MNIKKIALIFFLCATTLFAEEPNIYHLQEQQQEISVLKQKLNNQQFIIHQQQTKLINLSTKIKNQERVIDSLKSENQSNTRKIKTIENNLSAKIQQTETTAKDGISKLNKSISTYLLYWIGVTLAILLWGSIVYWLLGKRITSSKTDVEAQIKNTKKTLEEESVRLDSRLMEILEVQMKLKKEENQVVSTVPNKEIDHSLALKVADEIIRIQKNLQQMDSTTKGLKQLSASVKRIQDNFASNGYELIDMLGKEYNEGMKVIANFIPNENLDAGKQIITRIIKPQVNFKNEMIQSAQIEVSIGEKKI